ncbi:hypothetical protein LguiB_024516 [Lonicera macranthoides]
MHGVQVQFAKKEKSSILLNKGIPILQRNSIIFFLNCILRITCGKNGTLVFSMGSAILVEDEEYCEVERACGPQFCFSCLCEAQSPCSCQMCWQCGLPNTHDASHSHSCGRYKDEQHAVREKSELMHHAHYYNQFKAHIEFFKAEVKLKAKMLEKISTLEVREMPSTDFRWVWNGLYSLSRSRRILSYSYCITCLASFLVMKSRRRNCQIHVIAPYSYRSKGAEKAEELGFENGVLIVLTWTKHKNKEVQEIFFSKQGIRDMASADNSGKTTYNGIAASQIYWHSSSR